MNRGISNRREFLNLVYVAAASGLIVAIGQASQCGEAVPAPAAVAVPQAAGKPLIGAASISVTPDKPVALQGQMHTRIAKTVESSILAAGDQSPHLLVRKGAEERMRKLRGLTRLAEIARRIDVAWADVYFVGGKWASSRCD
jgi:hypothetical protein